MSTDASSDPMAQARYGVRRASPGDVEWIVALSARVQAALTASGTLQQIGPLPRAAVEASVRAGSAFVLESGPRLVGSVLVDPPSLCPDVPVTAWELDALPAPLRFLHSLMLEPSQQGKGLGKVLLDGVRELVAAEWHGRRGTIVLDCWAGNAKLRDFYARAGFLLHGVFPSGEGYDVAVFRVPVPADGVTCGTTRELLERQIGGGIARHLVYVAGKLGLAELLVDAPKSSAELAAVVGAHADTLRRVLRALVGIGLLVEEDGGRFALTEAGRLLRRDAPDALAGRVIKSVELGMAWGGLLNAVMTGERPFEHVFGEGQFARFAGDPAVAALGARQNPGTSWEVAQAIAAAYDFSRFETVIDVGGGDGTVLAAILDRYPHLGGIVLDQPHLMDDARRVAAQYGVEARTRVVGGDFFKAVPAGDVYVLKTILHDWDDAPATRILERCREAMSPHGRVLVVELLLPERATQGGGFTGDIMMLVETGGRERTEREYGAVFAAAGLELTEVRPLHSGRYAGRFLIEGAPANPAQT